MSEQKEGFFIKFFKGIKQPLLPHQPVAETKKNPVPVNLRTKDVVYLDSEDLKNRTVLKNAEDAWAEGNSNKRNDLSEDEPLS